MRRIWGKVRDEAAIEAIQFVVIACVFGVAMIAVFGYIYSQEHHNNNQTTTCIAQDQRVFSGNGC